MPKKSKIQSSKAVTSRPGEAPPIEETRSEYYCCRCKRRFKNQRGNFSASQSPIYFGNGKYLPICNHCLEELLEHYKSVLGTEEEAIKRLCLKFDIYWHPDIYAMVAKVNTSSSRIRSYISKTNLYKYVGKTYDDTIDEEAQAALEAEENNIIKVIPQNNTTEDFDEEIEVPEEVVKYWGVGLTPEGYMELESRRKYWMDKLGADVELDIGEDLILRQMCKLEVTINKDLAAGKPIEKNVNTLNTLAGSMNIKPSQKKEQEGGGVPFGCEIKAFEDENPIPEPDEQFQDVDGIRTNVIAWFLGSLCETAGIKNKYSAWFEDEMSRYTIQKPTYEEEDYETEEAGASNG